MPISLLNGLVGAICGFRFRILILAPLIAIAVIEATVLQRTGSSSSRIWSAVGLITLLEIGYLTGSVAAAYRTYARREGALRSWVGKFSHY